MLRYLSADVAHYCELRGTGMSKDKYPAIFSRQMEAIVFIILQIFFATRAVLEIGQNLTIIPRARVGYEMIDSQRGA